MNKLIKSVAFTAMTAGMMMSTGVAAKEQKIAIVNVEAIIAQLPQTATIQESLKNEFKDQIAAFEKLQADLKYNIEKQKRDGAIMSKTDKETLTKTIETQGLEYRQKGAAIQQQMGKRENEEKTKLIALIRTAIDSIAAKDKYDLILQQAGVAFSKPDADISSKVVEQVSKLK